MRATSHSSFELQENYGDLVFELQTLLLEPLEDFVGGRLFFRFDAMDILIDLIVACDKLPEVMVGPGQLPDEPDFPGKFILQLVTDMDHDTLVL
jgi:hypothetical protein